MKSSSTPNQVGVWLQGVLFAVTYEYEPPSKGSRTEPPSSEYFAITSISFTAYDPIRQKNRPMEFTEELVGSPLHTYFETAAYAQLVSNKQQRLIEDAA